MAKRWAAKTLKYVLRTYHRDGHLFTWIIQVLLNGGGADVNHEDNDKATPLHTAAQAGQIEVIRKLVRAEV